MISMFKNTQVNCVTDRKAVLFAAVYRDFKMAAGYWNCATARYSRQTMDIMTQSTCAVV